MSCTISLISEADLTVDFGSEREESTNAPYVATVTRALLHVQVQDHVESAHFKVSAQGITSKHGLPTRRAAQVEL